MWARGAALQDKALNRYAYRSSFVVSSRTQKWLPPRGLLWELTWCGRETNSGLRLLEMDGWLVLEYDTPCSAKDVLP